MQRLRPDYNFTFEICFPWEMSRAPEPWGFVVAVSAFMIQLLTFGVNLSFGLYVIELQKEFQGGLSLISVIGAINLGLQLGAGVFN